MPEKNRLNNSKINHGVFEMLEESINKKMETSKFMAPVLEKLEDIEPLIWYRYHLDKGISGDGSEYHIYVRQGSSNNLCIFLSGGGVAWNEYTAARPITGAKVMNKEPNYYWNNLRPVTQLMNINLGITDVKRKKNPFAEWNFVVITYSTGDFHVGNNNFVYRNENGEKEVLHFHGYKNFKESMKVATKLFKNPDKILIAGNSAGAFAVPVLTDTIADKYYKDCTDITLLSDSGQLLYKDWQKTAKDIWKCKDYIWKSIQTDNLTLDWYRALYKKHGNRFRYLYSSSIFDYLLSAYYNDVTNKVYETDMHVQKAFYDQLKEFTKELIKLNPEFGFYYNNWSVPAVTGTGTVHTAVREVYFTTGKQNGITMAEWLSDAVNGKVYNVGMELLDMF